MAAVAIAGCVALAACSNSSPRAGAPTSPPGPVSLPAPVYTSKTVWLCSPGGRDDPCESSETATVVPPTGQDSEELLAPEAATKVDCFYVYPTVSGQKTPIADLAVDPEERAIAITQASRFSHVCRVFAPIYRQATLSAIQGATAPGAKNANVDFGVGYQDVLTAWKDYLANDNHGRGVVFLGHSQGAGVLIRLLREQVDPNPRVRRLLVSAIVLGGNVTVARGRDVGGDFRHIRACRSRSQVHCVIAYSSFLRPPPANSLFGRPGTGPRAGQASAAGLQVLCVNPAAPAGGAALLTPYFTTTRFPGLLGTVAGPVPRAPTPWVSYPDRYSARCRTAGGATWLQITPASGDPRPAVAQTLGPTWGLHLYDFNLALGDLVALVGREAAAYR